jgi:trehalose 6-phosphate synthase
VSFNVKLAANCNVSFDEFQSLSKVEKGSLCPDKNFYGSAAISYVHSPACCNEDALSTLGEGQVSERGNLVVHLELLNRSKGVSVKPPGTGGRLIVVSNRVPVPSAGGPAAGGLAVALEAALKERGGMWFGWSGKTSQEPEPELQIYPMGQVSYAVTDLSRRDLDEYYHGFANRTLWPICHYRLDLADFSARETNGYFRVNETFARRLAKLLRPNDVVWVHDYHLIPMAHFLRTFGCENRIGFFLHIPWPSPDVAAALPAYETILHSFASYDLLGFQTVQDAENFRCGLLKFKLGRMLQDNWCEGFGRRFQVMDFPISIETEAFVEEARVAEKNAIVKRMRASLEGRDLVIGVDRLDYSKGITQRIDAFSTYLDRHPHALKNRTTMLQVTPKSRSEVPEYAMIQKEVAEHVGSTNGRLGDVDWTPIRYINKAISRSALAGLYRLARVGLVTPLRDGMNLVAKEYVAAQSPDNPGVLILSRFAGAAQELNGALLVNPYDIEGTAGAIAQAFAMRLEERKERWAGMMQTLKQKDVRHWARRFLSALHSIEDQALAPCAIGTPEIGTPLSVSEEAATPPSWLVASPVLTKYGH